MTMMTVLDTSNDSTWLTGPTCSTLQGDFMDPHGSVGESTGTAMVGAKRKFGFER
jgi:hypothetical protein